MLINVYLCIKYVSDLRFSDFVENIIWNVESEDPIDSDIDDGNDCYRNCCRVMSVILILLMEKIIKWETTMNKCELILYIEDNRNHRSDEEESENIFSSKTDGIVSKWKV